MSRTAVVRLLGKPRVFPAEVQVTHVPAGLDRHPWEVGFFCVASFLLYATCWWELGACWGLKPLWRALLLPPVFFFFLQAVVICTAGLLRFFRALSLAEKIQPAEFNTRLQFLYLTGIAAWLLSKPTALIGAAWLALFGINTLCALWEWAMRDHKNL